VMAFGATQATGLPGLTPWSLRERSADRSALESMVIGVATSPGADQPVGV
jgi:hypothetical protein